LLAALSYFAVAADGFAGAILLAILGRGRRRRRSVALISPLLRAGDYQIEDYR
jgi:hypothetical protein